jgi:hypothetical protein
MASIDPTLERESIAGRRCSAASPVLARRQPVAALLPAAKLRRTLKATAMPAAAKSRQTLKATAMSAAARSHQTVKAAARLQRVRASSVASRATAPAWAASAQAPQAAPAVARRSPPMFLPATSIHLGRRSRTAVQAKAALSPWSLQRVPEAGAAQARWTLQRVEQAPPALRARVAAAQRFVRPQVVASHQTSPYSPLRAKVA